MKKGENKNKNIWREAYKKRVGNFCSKRNLFKKTITISSFLSWTINYFPTFLYWDFLFNWERVFWNEQNRMGGVTICKISWQDFTFRLNPIYNIKSTHTYIYTHIYIETTSFSLTHIQTNKVRQPFTRHKPVERWSE